ncbi:uncharacterized protein PV09_07365 [Verruconis gallopava]|uniref:Uncharacterized protein n=1 Tax=Verruconis gallopava TaxID=253628 RepID=A0A0D2APJ9_9PEZI|nr:uncharacterized protein PV09_07365 [Verruconis gallopava]KIW01074.1 hypothetical protein PV09_07365 [Verruconis gallopava]
MWAAGGSTVTQTPTISDIRGGVFPPDEVCVHERAGEQYRSKASTATRGGSHKRSRHNSGLFVDKSKRTGTNLVQFDSAIKKVQEQGEYVHRDIHDNGVKEQYPTIKIHQPMRQTMATNRH